MKVTLLTAVLFVANLACGQIGSGTIVVFDFAKDKLTVAADSRLIREQGPADDSTCKISVFRHRIVFVSFGAEKVARTSNWDRIPVWDNWEVAYRAVLKEGDSTPDFEGRLDRIGSLWARTLASYWRLWYRTDPETVKHVAEVAGGWVIAGGAFAAAQNGSIYWRNFGVVLYPGMDPPVQAVTGEATDCWPCGKDEKVCALGRPAVPAEYCTQSSPRARDEAARWSVSPELASKVSRETLHAIRLVDLTAAFDVRGGIGGRIDALELHKDGNIQWIYRKDNCPENRD